MAFEKLGLSWPLFQGIPLCSIKAMWKEWSFCNQGVSSVDTLSPQALIARAAVGVLVSDWVVKMRAHSKPAELLLWAKTGAWIDPCWKWCDLVVVAVTTWERRAGSSRKRISCSLWFSEGPLDGEMGTQASGVKGLWSTCEICPSTLHFVFLSLTLEEVLFLHHVTLACLGKGEKVELRIVGCKRKGLSGFCKSSLWSTVSCKWNISVV